MDTGFIKKKKKTSVKVNSTLIWAEKPEWSMELSSAEMEKTAGGTDVIVWFGLWCPSLCRR